MYDTEMAVGISVVAAILVGWLVSLDVYGLLVSQRAIFKIEAYHNSRRKLAFLHASVHSGAFFVYSVILSGLIDFPSLIGQTLAWLNINWQLPFDGKALSATMGLLSSVVIVLFVWATYSAKISEDHSEKLDPKVLNGLRFDIRAFYYWWKNRAASNYRKFQMAMALLVAVDMLAVTSFIRVFFKFAKGNYILYLAGR
ncbi:hypothetical protein [Novosphingobium sp.]|uniref:hypothetical protein n=1 Tax=Novosphingobium sp. TaxID=1874826 RepID=UPI0025FA3149|nr:hypothetical protein [Novosphingobium sp.]MCC6925720.1 hypothetical protein [Novosphingobium sp.]